MLNKYLCVILVLNGVSSDGPDECVRYYFEDYDDLFTQDRGCFSGDASWNLQSYDNSTIISAPNEKSKLFIEVSSSAKIWSCTSSFIFTIMPGGIVEANVYVKTDASDYLMLFLRQVTETGFHLSLDGFAVVTPATGWQVIRMTNTSALTGNPPFRAYVSNSNKQVI